jgi:hypothetical protein
VSSRSGNPRRGSSQRLFAGGLAPLNGHPVVQYHDTDVGFLWPLPLPVFLEEDKRPDDDVLPASARLVRCHGSRRSILDRTDRGHSGSSVGTGSSGTKRSWERALGNGRAATRCARCWSIHSWASNQELTHITVSASCSNSHQHKAHRNPATLKRTAPTGRFSSSSRKNQAAGRATATNLFPSGSRR